MAGDNQQSAPLRGPYLRPSAAARYLDVSPSTLWALIKQNRLPRPLKLSPGVSLFS